jgi:hypothetical protein
VLILEFTTYLGDVFLDLIAASKQSGKGEKRQEYMGHFGNGTKV